MFSFRRGFFLILGLFTSSEVDVLPVTETNSETRQNTREYLVALTVNLS